MENFFSMWKVRELADKVTNVVMNYTEIEAKVREATNDEAWGPTGQIMQELAHSTFTYEHFPEVMSMLWKRMLQDNKQNWRRTYKSLLLLNYLIKNGSERVVTSAREHIYDLRSLENYTFIDDTGKDQGVNIRHKVKELIDFVQDDDRLREERKKAKKNKDKYTGISSDTFGMRFGSTENWDDRPSYNRSREDYPSEKEWDDTSSSYPNTYRDHTFDEEVEGKGDSDTESAKNQKQVTKKYSDSENGTNRVQTENRVNLSLNASLVTSPKKNIKPLKKVDLGAAATFGRESVQSPVPVKTSTANDLLNDDFDPRAGENIQSSNSLSDMDDIESAFGVKGSSEEFADFTSAFSSAPSPAQNANFAQFHQVNNFPSFGAAPISTGQPMVGSASQPIISPSAQAMIPPMVQPIPQSMASPLVQPFTNQMATPISQPNMLSSAPSTDSLMGASFLPHANLMGNIGTVITSPAAPISQGNNINDLLGDLDGLNLQQSMVGGQNNNPISSGPLLMPTTVQPLQPVSSKANNNTESKLVKTQAVGQTWTNSGNLNIDLDNLLISKPKQGPSLSMNQLASNPTSPVNQPRINQISPAFGNQMFNSQNLGGFNQTNNDLFANFK
ncbi:hypothetical protein WA026_014902 [Henosepilachna vigintioctopunctata]|uniref:ENTH domain-containing protein n=1 Tax=Henosepilachna vigintioctopunctata TaxID=420089 RepID=A0AAW1V1J5_9CUCU